MALAVTFQDARPDVTFQAPPVGDAGDAAKFLFWGLFFLAAGGAVGYAVGVERSIRGGIHRGQRRRR